MTKQQISDFLTGAYFDENTVVRVKDLRHTLMALCPEPEKPEPPFAPAEKDRAAEMVEKMTGYDARECPPQAAIIVAAHETAPILSVTCGGLTTKEILADLRKILAGAMREYADEMLEKAAELILEPSPYADFFSPNRIASQIRSLKSTAKGAANG